MICDDAQNRKVYTMRLQTIVAMIFIFCGNNVFGDSIPDIKRDQLGIFEGNPADFQRIPYFDFKKVFAVTPEVALIKREKVDPSSGNYQIQIANASSRVQKSVSDFFDTKGDLIITKQYWEKLKPASQSIEITYDLVSRITDVPKEELSTQTLAEALDLTVDQVEALIDLSDL